MVLEITFNCMVEDILFYEYEKYVDAFCKDINHRQKSIVVKISATSWSTLKFELNAIC